MAKRDKLNPAIYSITNISNNKRYIGSATRLKERWRVHKYLLRKNKHFNNHLQSSWNKYGEENFNFEIIELITDCDISKLVDTLIKKEEHFILYYNSNNPKFGYNHRTTCNSNLGNKMSEEQKIKLSIAKKGKYTEAQRQARIKCGFERRGIPNDFISNWWKELPQEQKDEIINKKVNSLKETNKYKKEKFGSIITKEHLNKLQTTRVERGTSKVIQAYNLDGSFYKKYNSCSQILKDFFISVKNSLMIKNGILFCNKILKIGNEPMTKDEYFDFKKKINSFKLNLKYKKVSVDGSSEIFNTKNECAQSIGLSKQNDLLKQSFENKSIYKGYYWEIIEPITGDSIYENGVKTGKY